MGNLFDVPEDIKRNWATDDDKSSRQLAEKIADLISNGHSKNGLYQLEVQFCSHRRSYCGVGREPVEKKLELKEGTITCWDQRIHPPYVPPYALPKGSNYVSGTLYALNDHRGWEILSEACKRRDILLNPYPVPNLR